MEARWAQFFGMWVLGACAWCTLARADPGPAVVLRVSSVEERALATRVGGQIGDLPVTLITEEAPEVEALSSAREQNQEPEALPEQLAAARALVRSHGARAVIWFVWDGKDVTVRVADPESGRLLVRRIARSEGELGSSAQQEAIALVVRTALRALLEGGEIGEREPALVTPEVNAAEIAPPAGAPARANTPAPERREPHSTPSRSLRALQGLGARAVWDGASERGSYALTGRFGIEWAPLRFELRGAVGLFAAVSPARGELELARHALSAHVAWLWQLRERLVCALGLGAGAAFYRGRAQADGAGFTPRAPRLALGFASADLNLAFLPRWGGGRFGWAGTLGADLYPRTPRLGYEDARGSFVRGRRLGYAQPNLMLEAFVRFP
jgi:hypothetical protein